MKTNNETVSRLLEVANRYPSPHNGQPVRLQQIADERFILYFQKERGLQATDISYIFSFVSMGVFVEHMTLSAEALGHTFEYELDLPREADLRGKGHIKFASCRLQWNTRRENPELLQSLLFRQTSRKKYSEGIMQSLTDEIIGIADHKGMRLTQLNPAQAKQAIWLNQQAVFDDMFDESVRRELAHWLRYSLREKSEKKDGLAYDCMELNGRLLKFIVNHPKILRRPGMSAILKQYYLRTMSDASDVFYMMSPFANEHDAFEVGRVIMNIWTVVSREGYYLHPFGTIMSNHTAHNDFLKLAGIDQENRQQSYLVFIFRCGRSPVPVPSFRKPIDQHLRMES